MTPVLAIAINRRKSQPLTLVASIGRPPRKEYYNRKMKLDITFNVYTDANGGDPDSTSPTLRSYHKLLWSKPLPNGHTFVLDNRKSGTYL